MVLVALIASMATSLGVGSSTLAIINFFVAIADGKIDETERRMMGNVYIVLRVAMVILFFTLTLKTGFDAYHLGADAFTPALFASWTVLGVLYLNAILMTLRIMPSTFGPGIQAGSWYTLGGLTALLSIGISASSYLIFVMAYVTFITFAVSLVNGIMAILKAKKEARERALEISSGGTIA